jgi:hypothetical protein
VTGIPDFPEPRDLSPFDYLVYSIGEAAQLHVRLESDLRWIWTILRDQPMDPVEAQAPDVHLQLWRSGDPPSPRAPRYFDELLKKLATRTAGVEGLPLELKEAAATIFDRVAQSTRWRNRVVHDQWISKLWTMEGEYLGIHRENLAPQEPKPGQPADPASTPELADARGCVAQLGDCSWMLSQLRFVLGYFYPRQYRGVSGPVDPALESLRFTIDRTGARPGRTWSVQQPPAAQ